MADTPSTENLDTKQPSSKPLAFIKFGLIEILFVVTVLALFFGTLNYFNIFPISKTFPFLSFLPTRSTLSSCRIVEEQFCSQGKLLEQKTANGKTFKLIGLNLPEGTPIYAPIDGQLSKATINQPSMYKGLLARIGNPPTITSSNPTFFIRGDLTFSNMINAETKKGEQIATVNSSGITNLGSYNVVLEVGINPNAKNAPSPESVLKEMFPLAFEKPPEEANPQ